MFVYHIESYNFTFGSKNEQDIILWSKKNFVTKSCNQIQWTQNEVNTSNEKGKY